MVRNVSLVPTISIGDLIDKSCKPKPKRYPIIRVVFMPFESSYAHL